MVTRRTVCSLGAGLSAAALLGVSAVRGSEQADIRYVITDQRYMQSLEFGAILTDEGAKRLEVTEGLTRLWQEALVPLWREPGGMIAGLTQPGTWACVAEQARSCGRRTVLIGRHKFMEDQDTVEHALSASPHVLAGTPALEKSGKVWPRVMAQLAMQCPTNMRTSPNQRFRSSAVAAINPSVPLVSWVIA